MSVKDYLNKRVFDPYGRTLGKVIACTGEGVRDDLLLGIEVSDGGFLSTPRARLVPKGESLVLDESWRTRSENLRRELSVAIRKTSALNRLYNEGEVSKEAYDGLNSDYGSAVASLSKRKETLQQRIEERSKSSSSQIREMESYLVNLKIGHELGEVDNEAYLSGRDALGKLLSQLQAELKDLEAARLCLLEPSPALERPVERTVERPVERRLPPIALEPLQNMPIVVRIREADSRTEG